MQPIVAIRPSFRTWYFDFLHAVPCPTENINNIDLSRTKFPIGNI